MAFSVGIGTILMAGGSILLLLAFYKMRQVRTLGSMLDHAVETLQSGLLLFDKKDRLVHQNRMAGVLISALTEDQSLRSLDGFLDYIFSHKTKISCLYRAQAKAEENVHLHQFQEVIETGGQTCLVQATEFQSGETAVFLTDISDLKNREAQLCQMQKLEALGQLAGGVAHDFNNVLSIIDGYARMSGNCLPAGDERLADYLGRIRKACGRGSALTRQLLLFDPPDQRPEAALKIIAGVIDGTGGRSGARIVCCGYVGRPVANCYESCHQCP